MVCTGTSTNKEDMTRSNISSGFNTGSGKTSEKKCNRAVTSHKLYLPGSRLIGQKKKKVISNAITNKFIDRIHTCFSETERFFTMIPRLKASVAKDSECADDSFTAETFIMI